MLKIVTVAAMAFLFFACSVEQENFDKNYEEILIDEASDDSLVIESGGERLSISNADDVVQFEYTNAQEGRSELSLNLDPRSQDLDDMRSRSEEFVSAMSQSFSEQTGDFLGQREDRMGHFASHVFDNFVHEFDDQIMFRGCVCKYCERSQSCASVGSIPK